MTRWTGCSIVALLVAAPLHADDQGVTVVGVGETRAKPNRLELEVRNSGTAELAGDANVKLRDSLRRTQEAYEKLKVPNLKLEPLNVTVGTDQPGINELQMMMNGVRQPNQTTHITVVRPTRVVVTNVDRLSEEEVFALVAKLIDAAKDSGATVGPPTSANIQNYYRMMMLGIAAGGDQKPSNLAALSLDDGGAAHDAAVDRAFADAKRRGERLAKLAGGSLGGVVSMSELSSDALDTDVSSGNGSPDSKKKSPNRPGGNAISESTVRVTLQVRFELKTAGGK